MMDNRRKTLTWYDTRANIICGSKEAEADILNEPSNYHLWDLSLPLKPSQAPESPLLSLRGFYQNHKFSIKLTEFSSHEHNALLSKFFPAYAKYNCVFIENLENKYEIWLFCKKIETYLRARFPDLEIKLPQFNNAPYRTSLNVSFLRDFKITADMENIFALVYARKFEEVTKTLCLGTNDTVYYIKPKLVGALLDCMAKNAINLEALKLSISQGDFLLMLQGTLATTHPSPYNVAFLNQLLEGRREFGCFFKPSAGKLTATKPNEPKKRNQTYRLLGKFSAPSTTDDRPRPSLHTLGNK